jgi:hypothetical protein
MAMDFPSTSTSVYDNLLVLVKVAKKKGMEGSREGDGERRVGERIPQVQRSFLQEVSNFF